MLIKGLFFATEKMDLSFKNIIFHFKTQTMMTTIPRGHLRQIFAQ